MHAARSIGRRCAVLRKNDARRCRGVMRPRGPADIHFMKGQGRAPRRLITDKLHSYSPAHRRAMPSVVHSTTPYENNRAELSHQPTRQRERQMRRFKSAAHVQRFVSVHGLVRNPFRVGRHLLRAAHHRLLRTPRLAGLERGDMRLLKIVEARPLGIGTHDPRQLDSAQ